MILISGSNGLLGANLKEFFNKKKIKYCTIGRKNCHFNGDIQDYPFVEKTIKDLMPEIFINLAAITDVDYCENNKEATYKINTEFPEVVAKAMKSNSEKYYIIQISTDQIYNGKGPHLENAPNPINEYSRSKFEIEKKLIKYNSICLRTNFFGKSEHATKLSFSDKIYNSCINKSNLNLFKDVYFSPVSFNTIFKVIEILIKKKITGIYNLGTKNGMTKEEFAVYFCKCLNLNNKYIIGNSLKDINLSAKRPGDMRLDSSKLEADLNIQLQNLRNEINSIKDSYIK